MRRSMFIAALAVVCLGAGEGQIEGWKVLQGNWTPASKGKVVTFGGGEYGRLISNDSKGDFTLSFRLSLDHFDDAKSSFSIYWAMKSPDGPDSYKRYQAVFKAEAIIFNRGETPDDFTEVRRAAFAFPMKKWVAVQLRRKGQTVLLRVGSEKINLDGLLPDDGHVAFHYAGVSGGLRDLKLDVK